MKHLSQIFLRRSGLLVWLVFSAVTLPADETNGISASGMTVEVRVSGFRNNDGVARVSLFGGPDGFPQDWALACATNTLSITGNAVRVVFSGVSTGQYAVAVLHDENADGRMNVSILGVPREGYGVSNNAKGKFGAPGFDASRFDANGSNIVLSVVMTY